MSDAAVVTKSAHRGAYIEMLLSSIVSMIAAFVLSVEAWQLAADANAVFSCDINAKISCGAVAMSWQAKVFGFPNSYLGLIFESIVITICVAALGGVKFPRWFMLGAQAMYSFAIGFAYWLFYQAYFHIHALCPWCLSVTFATTLVFASMTRINILDGNIRFGKATPTVQKLIREGVDHAIVVAVIAIVVVMIFARYL